MYVLTRFEIDGFWNSHIVQSNLRDDVNIFIGLNGTGKTTLINLLQAALTVDVALLHRLSFKEIRLFLKQGTSTRRITITRKPRDSVYDFVKYKISQRVLEVPLVPNDMDMRRRFHSRYFHDLTAIRKNMAALVEVSWLSVHRQVMQDDEYERPTRMRTSEQLLNPVDTRLVHLLGKLSDYHLGLQAKGNDVSAEFQKKVLSSLLYSSTFDTFDFHADDEINYEEMRDHLYHAYEALGITSGIRKRIDEHVEKIQKSISTIREQKAKNEAFYVNDVLPYSLFKRTRSIVESSMEADAEKRALFELLDLFVTTVNKFLDGKTLTLAPNQEYGLSMKKAGEEIEFPLLSSGEKQLFILLAETVLQNRRQSIFIADEPELSLHVAWQRKLLSAVRKLNPNAQLVVATHSPEIAGPWRENLIKMREVISK